MSAVEIDMTVFNQIYTEYGLRKGRKFNSLLLII